MGVLEVGAAWGIGLVLLHASYYDVRYAVVHDLHWIVVGVIGVVVAVANGGMDQAVVTAGMYGVFAGALWIVNLWGSGDALLLTALGVSAYPIPTRFFFGFSVVALFYLLLHKTFRRKKARFAPVFLVTWVLVYSWAGVGV